MSCCANVYNISSLIEEGMSATSITERAEQH